MSKKDSLSQPLKFVGKRVTWYWPTSIDQLTDLKEKFPDAHIVAGNTKIGIETWVNGHFYPVIVTPVRVKEMSKIEVKDQGTIRL